MPFGAADVLILGLVVVFAGWALRAMVLALRSDAGRRDLLRTFAAQHRLREREAAGPRSEADVTVEGLMRRWSRNPALAEPPRGSPVFEGTLHGLPFVVDEVLMRDWWSSSRNACLRMVVELPGVPSGLKVFPAGWMQRLVRPSRLAVSFSRRAEDRTREEVFLSPDRRQVLEDYADGKGDVYLHGGRLFLIRPWKATREVDLARLHEEIGPLATRLVGRGPS